jgi:hypothetical protein
MGTIDARLAGAEKMAPVASVENPGVDRDVDRDVCGEYCTEVEEEGEKKGGMDTRVPNDCRSEESELVCAKLASVKEPVCANTVSSGGFGNGSNFGEVRFEEPSPSLEVSLSSSLS